MEKVIPSTGMKGYFELEAPFNRYNINKVICTCRAVRNINEYDREVRSLFNSVYAQHGLSEQIFNQDRRDNQYILSLQSEFGQWVIVPTSYVKRFPEVNGVAYHNLMLGVNLGSVPTEQELSILQERISNVVFDTLGVRPNIRSVQLSKSIIVSREFHQEVQTARQSRAEIQLSDSARVRHLSDVLERAKTQIRALEGYIKSHLH